MRTTKQLSITLPNTMAEALKECVASGAHGGGYRTPLIRVDRSVIMFT